MAGKGYKKLMNRATTIKDISLIIWEDIMSNIKKR